MRERYTVRGEKRERYICSKRGKERKSVRERKREWDREYVDENTKWIFT